MTIEKLIELFFSLFGLYLAICFRQVGRSAIEQQKRFNKIMPTHSDKDFGKSAVIVTQIAFLVAGIFIFFIGLIKFLN